YLNIALGDARDQSVEDNSVDLIVSSSPYMTSYEYADLHQLSTIWLDFTEDLKQYRTRFIGSSSRPENRHVLRSEFANNIVLEMKDKNKKLSQEIGSFFLDMEQVFDESYRILKSGGRCCFVIGNTSLKGVDILNAQIFAESIQHSGFTLDRIIKREIPSKILPQTRDKKTGRFTSSSEATSIAYPVEYIVIGKM
ncbi:MAG: class I SAM-dependent methyltransferase, partial [Candidatus Thorarchaeota archaeon]